MSPVVALLPSYVSGTSEVPLLGETIGDNFDRTVAADPAREESAGILDLGEAAAIRNA
jgi:hypothetical protein